MTDLTIDVFVSADGYAFGGKSPAYFGYDGPDLQAWINEQMDRTERMLLGRRTYVLLNSLPEEVRDDGWRRLSTEPSTVFSRTLDEVEWPGAVLCADDVVDEVARLKKGTENLRTAGSLSLGRQLLAAGLVDHLRLLVFPLVLGESGQEPALEGIPDLGLELLDHAILDGRIAYYDYRPAGLPPYAS